MEHALTVTNSWTTERTSDPDELLITRVAQSDRAALDILYYRHAARVLGYLTQIISDRGLAEEILQDSFVVVWQAAARFEGRSSVRTWLIGIARRQAHNVLRRRNLTLTDDSMLDQFPSAEPEPETTVLINADRAELAEAVARLGPTQREVLSLAFAQELSYGEMAEILDVPVGTVKSRLSNAKRQLREVLEAAGLEH